MPPLHEYKCENCQLVMEVQRSFNDHNIPPLEAEEPLPCKATTEGAGGGAPAKHLWKKMYMGQNIQWVRGSNWRYAKPK